MNFASEIWNKPAAAAAAAGDVVTKSLRFNLPDSPHLSRTFGTGTSTTVFTYSMWVKMVRGSPTNGQYILDSEPASGDETNLCITGSAITGGPNTIQLAHWDSSAGALGWYVRTNALFRDYSGWYHFTFCVDTGESGADIVKIWQNGNLLSHATASYPSGNHYWNEAVVHNFGRWESGAARHYDGYLADVYFIDGVALTPTSFAEEDATTGQWKPKAYDTADGAYGNNGFHLAFDSEDGQVFALQSDAVDGNTTFTDLSQHTHAITANGNAHHSTDVSDPAAGSKSSMYFDGTGDYISSTDAKDVANFDNSDWTLEFWARPSNTFGSVNEIFMGCGGGVGGWNATNGHSWTLFAYDSANEIYFQYWTGSTIGLLSASDDLVPANTWTHIAVVNQSGTKRLYIGGIQRDTNTDTKATISTPSTLNIGDSQSLDGEFEGYIHNVSIQRDFCKYKDGTTFTPSTSPVTALSADIGFDSSSNGNHFDATNLDAASDVVNDTPTNNFCTWNPISGPPRTSSTVMAEGNLKVTGQYNSSAQYYPRFMGTMAASSGKWFYELRKNGATSGWYEEVGFKGINTTWPVGSHGLAGASTAGQWVSDGEIAWNANDGGIRTSNSGTALATGVGGGFSADGDVIGLALDLDASPRTLKFFKNGSATTSTTASVDLPTGGPDAFHPALDCTNTTLSTTTTNFGQDATFAGTESGTTYTTDAGGDDTGGEFYHQPPAGYKAWTTKNLTATIAKPSEHFDIKTWTATSTNPKVLDFPWSFATDGGLVWQKMRNSSGTHHLFDTVRGDNKGLYSNLYDVENAIGQTEYYTQDFDSSGDYSIQQDGVGNEVNYSGNTYVAWGWKKSAAAGFNIVGWTGDDDGFSGGTQAVAHGLGVAPEMVIAKNRTNEAVGNGNWIVYHKDTTSGDLLKLNTLGAEFTPNSTLIGSIGSTNVSFGNDSIDVEYLNSEGWSGTPDTYIGYFFASVEGFSKVGSYTGNALADGTFVYCGFRPSYVMIKNVDASSPWYIVDSARSPYNEAVVSLEADVSDAEQTDSNFLDLSSNGFKIRTTGAHVNGSGNKIIFYAVGQSSKYANAR